MEMAFIPLAQTLFTVVARTVSGNPANFEHCLAGACPNPACNTDPIINSSTNDTSMPAFSQAAFTAAAPSWVADNDLNCPPKLPIGVLTAESIYTYLLFIYIDYARVSPSGFTNCMPVLAKLMICCLYK